MDKRIPLPGNKWRLISSYSETVLYGSAMEEDTDALYPEGSYEVLVIVLAEVERKMLTKVVLIQMPLNIPNSISLGMRDECRKDKNLFCQETSKSGTNQSQWWINGLFMDQQANGQRFVEDLFGYFDKHGIDFPATMYAVHFQFVKPMDSLSVSYLWNYEAGRLQLNTLIQWGLRWNDRVREGFESDDMPVNCSYAAHCRLVSPSLYIPCGGGFNRDH